MRMTEEQITYYSVFVNHGDVKRSERLFFSIFFYPQHEYCSLNISREAFCFSLYFISVVCLMDFKHVVLMISP